MNDKKPTTITLPNGDVYRATVLRVTKSDGRGPREFTILREDESVKVEDNMAFWIVYASEVVLDEKVN